MNKSRLIIALVILLGLTATVVVTTRSRESEGKAETPSATLPSLKKEELTSLEITRPGQPTIVLQKHESTWKLIAPVSAQASASAVEAALEKLSELSVSSVAATRKENYARLEVDAEHAIRVKAKAGDKQLADLHVGAAKSGGTMLRVEGQDEVLAVRGSIRYAFDKEPKDFRKREITELEASELTALDVRSEKGSFRFERQGDAWTQKLEPKEKPIANFDPEKVQGLASAAAGLRALDFGEGSEAEAVTGLSAPRSKVVLTKKDGSQVEISVGKELAGGQESYLRVNTSDVLYRVSSYTAGRLMPDAKAFEKSEPKPEPAAQGGGMPAGGGELPPEIMEQLQRQLQNQGVAPH